MLEVLDVIEMIGIGKTAYRNSMRDMTKAEIRAMAETYYSFLKDYSPEVVKAGFRKAIEVCKFFPTVAEVTEQIRSIQTSFELSEGELFAQLKSAAGKAEDLFGQFNYTFVCDGKTQGERAREEVRELYESLDPVLKEYIGGVSGLLSLARNDEEQWGYERARFARSLETNRRRVQIKTEMPEMGKLLTGNALKQLN